MGDDPVREVRGVVITHGREQLDLEVRLGRLRRRGGARSARDRGRRCRAEPSTTRPSARWSSSWSSSRRVERIGRRGVIRRGIVGFARLGYSGRDRRCRRHMAATVNVLRARVALTSVVAISFMKCRLRWAATEDRIGLIDDIGHPLRRRTPFPSPNLGGPPPRRSPDSGQRYHHRRMMARGLRNSAVSRPMVGQGRAHRLYPRDDLIGLFDDTCQVGLDVTVAPGGMSTKRE